MQSDLVEFIQSSFKSVWSLELLTFMQAHADRAWRMEELVRELRGSAPVVTQSLGMLQAAGLVADEGEGSFRYAPASEEIGRLAGNAVDAYREKPGSVRRAILIAPNDKLHTFADAFRLKQD